MAQGVSLTLARMRYPAFTKGGSLWCNYKAMAEDKITSITGTLHLTRSSLRIDHFLVNVLFDPEEFDVAKYGLPYCDEELEQSINDTLGRALGLKDFSKVSYTEQGMQARDLVSLEAYNLLDTISSLSAHRLMQIGEGRNLIAELVTPQGRWDFRKQRSQSDPESEK